MTSDSMVSICLSKINRKLDRRQYLGDEELGFWMMMMMMMMMMMVMMMMMTTTTMMMMMMTTTTSAARSADRSTYCIYIDKYMYTLLLLKKKGAL